MTLRQWYAGLVLQALLSNPNFCLGCESAAIDALLYTDALLAELSREKP